MPVIHTFIGVRMNSGPDRNVELWSYGETPSLDSGRWLLRDAGTKVGIQLDEIHVSERNSRRSELQAAIEAFFGFPINLRDLLSEPPDALQSRPHWPNTWDRP